MVAIGLAAAHTMLTDGLKTGWVTGSFGLHGDDGKLYVEKGSGVQYTEPFSEGDVIGCGFDRTKHVAYFTRNGKQIGTSFPQIERRSITEVGCYSQARLSGM
jgi:hypothetical protein